jgi:hypothetical protein
MGIDSVESWLQDWLGNILLHEANVATNVAVGDNVQ